MMRLFVIVLGLMAGLVVVGFVLAHFGLVVALVMALVLLGRYLRRHGA